MFYALMMEAVLSVEDQGTNYSPFRRYAAIVLVLFVYRMSRRFGLWPVVCAGVAAVLGGLAVSPEQAIGATCGLLGWFALRAWRSRSRQLWLATSVFAAGAASCFASLIPSGYFEEFHAAASGGHSFPILATPYNASILFLYALAICIAYGCIQRSALSSLNEKSSVACLYVFTGLAMLPAAFGRCDAGHFRLAFPALILAVATLLAIPRARAWFSVPALFIYLQIFSYGAAALQRVPDQVHSARLRRANNQYLSGPLGDSAILPPPTAANLPCDRKYYTPSIILALGPPYRLACVDLGFRQGVADSYTSVQVERQVDDLRSRSGVPLLLLNRPLSQEFAAPETFLTDLPALEGGPTAYLPKVRHQAVSLSPLIDYIVANYQPGPTLLNNQVRVWNPKK